jgi:hypothetical protein
MVVEVGFCKIKVDSNFLLVLKIKCKKFHQDRSKTVDLHTKYTNKQTFSFILGVGFERVFIFCVTLDTRKNERQMSVSTIET